MFERIYAERKSSSSGKIILQIVAHIATCIFNDGISNILRIIEALELHVGTESYNFARKRDEQRVKLAERSLNDGFKNVRKEAMSIRKTANIDEMDAERMLYGPGIAD